MGKVIALPPSRNVAQRQSGGGTAEILFFTGVRYYRLSDEDFAKLASPTSAKRPAKVKAITTKAVAPARKLRKRA